MTIVFVIIMGVILLQQKKLNDIPTKNTTDKRVVTTTIYPLYFITKQIVGDTIEVKRLIKPGNEVHSFSPTPTDMVELQHSDLLITLGEKIEPWISKLNHSVEVNTLQLEDRLQLLSSETVHHHEHHSEETDHINPHVWLNFDNDIKIIEMIQKRLSRLYPLHKELFVSNASKLKKQFLKLDTSYKKSLQGCKKNTILVGHDAFGYMEKQYHFETQSIMGIFAHSRPNASKMAQLTESIKSKKLQYLLIDPVESSKSALQLAHDNKLAILPLYTLGNIPLNEEKQGKNMLSLLRQNLITLTQGLECQ